MSQILKLSILLLLFTLPACMGSKKAEPADDGHGHDAQAEADHQEAEGADDHDDHDADQDEGAGHDDHEDEGGPIKLSDTQYASAAIELVTAGPGEVGVTISMPAVVRPDSDTVTHINPVAAGVVASIHKHLGEEVQAGELLATVDSVMLGSAVARYLEAKAMTQAGEMTLAKETTLFENRIRTAVQVLDGIIKVNQEIYDREQELRAKAVSTIRPLLEADKNLKQAVLDKERQLIELQAERDTRLLKLNVDLTERLIDEQSSRNQLLALGVASSAIKGLRSDGDLVSGRYEIRATRSGIITNRHITLGEYVDRVDVLFTIQDLSRVWVIASAFEQHIQAVRGQQRAIVSLNAFPDQSFAAMVDLIGYEVDASSRSVGVRIELDNPKLSSWPESFPIRPGMFGTVELVVEQRQAKVAIPESALIHGEGQETSVFVLIAPNTFESRVVQVGLANSEEVEIISGLQVGEKVAVAGGFYLKSTMRQGELGEGHEH
jgi:membrane fusion protein, heavy metal efflux system